MLFQPLLKLVFFFGWFGAKRVETLPQPTGSILLAPNFGAKRDLILLNPGYAVACGS